MAMVGGANVWFTVHADRAGLLSEDALDSLVSGIWIKAALPATVFALSAPLALLIQNWVYLLWPIAYLGIIVYYTVKRLAKPRPGAVPRPRQPSSSSR
jgi:hypothetical protein